MAKQTQQQPQVNPEEMLEILKRTNQRLAGKVASSENDLALAHTQIEMLQETVQALVAKIQELEAANESGTGVEEESKKATPKKTAPKKAASKKQA